MNFTFIHHKTTKLGSQRITVKSSDVSSSALFAESSIIKFLRQCLPVYSTGKTFNGPALGGGFKKLAEASDTKLNRSLDSIHRELIIFNSIW